MADYRKKPVEVEAVQWDGGPHPSVDPVTATLWVEKSRAWCKISIGDYIVTEPDGVGFYPCTAEIFEASHERND